jgi:hypothetical protein
MVALRLMAVWLFCSAVFVFVSVIDIASEWLLPAAGGAWSGKKFRSWRPNSALS